MPYKSCPVCFATVFVLSNKHTLIEHYEKQHPDILRRMQDRGGLKGYVGVQSAIQRDQVVAETSLQGRVTLPLARPSPAVSPAPRSNNLCAEKANQTDPQITDTHLAFPVMLDLPPFPSAVPCVCCQTYFPRCVTAAQVGAHYIFCYEDMVKRNDNVLIARNLREYHYERDGPSTSS